MPGYHWAFGCMHMCAIISFDILGTLIVTLRLLSRPQKPLFLLLFLFKQRVMAAILTSNNNAQFLHLIVLKSCSLHLQFFCH